MNAHTQEPREHGFIIGLFAGAVVGAGLAMWLVPRRAAELRERMTDSARGLGQRAADGYQQASTRVGEAVEELTLRGQGVRDDVAEAVARGARELERYARAAKSDRAPARKHSAASKPRSL